MFIVYYCLRNIQGPHYFPNRGYENRCKINIKFRNCQIFRHLSLPPLIGKCNRKIYVEKIVFSDLARMKLPVYQRTGNIPKACPYVMVASFLVKCSVNLRGRFSHRGRNLRRVRRTTLCRNARWAVLSGIDRGALCFFCLSLRHSCRFSSDGNSRQ